jgi:hypothetical protein
MGRKIGSKNKKTKITKTTNKNTNINNVHVHVENKITRKRRTTKPKEDNNNINSLSNTIGASRPASSNLGFHPRGLINNEPQQPTNNKNTFTNFDSFDKNQLKQKFFELQA